MNSKSLLILGMSILVNSLWVTSAKASTFIFERQYDSTEPNFFPESMLYGTFRATDKNKDGFISANEVNLFEGTFRQDNFLLEISALEPKVIDQFSYEIGTNNLAFNIRSDRPKPPEPNFGVDTIFNVNFARDGDFFIFTDIAFGADDLNKTGIVILDPNPNTPVPEPNSSLALLILGGLGIISISKKH
ncbi:PEP-CTERM sorting domain-containing protein [Crocosphaera sp. XPORK-15E]|uniref:PEP-CTERM sorting domain-containing protein n=1 Tax=Crocosphaera sp. XPORK-15E TaxID=3110247 RepID=UPI002B21D11C|nr:PEP-CTERM sorting domain-containing protein [Crocosphaera sp. XPORK-15E]MEA5534360.1 PEP-CTERM sorting domain-containing protein [Crocosphaera sp. XPORK-15E]